jgi:hypothetical protein
MTECNIRAKINMLLELEFYAFNNELGDSAMQTILYLDSKICLI